MKIPSVGANHFFFLSFFFAAALVAEVPQSICHVLCLVILQVVSVMTAADALISAEPYLEKVQRQNRVETYV